MTIGYLEKNPGDWYILDIPEGFTLPSSFIPYRGELGTLPSLPVKVAGPPGTALPVSYNGAATTLPVSYNGAATLPFNGSGSPQPGDSPYEQTGVAVAGLLTLAGLLALVKMGGSIAIGAIKGLIARVGWQAVLSVVGTTIFAKIVSMLNDPDDTMVELSEAAGVGQVVKRWKANGREFWMTSDGRMFVRRKNGVIKSWKPTRPLVLVPGGRLNIKTAVRAQRFLDRQWRTIAKRTKQLKLA